MARGTSVRLAALLTATLASSNAASQEPIIPVPHVDMRARWGFLLVPVSPADGCPLARADEPLAELKATCSEFAKKARSAKTKSDRDIFANTTRQCVADYTRLYITLLQQRYAYADFAEVGQQMKSASDPGQLECLLAASHNANANAEIERKQAERNASEKSINDSYASSEAKIRSLSDPVKPEPPSTGKTDHQALALVLQELGRALQGQGAATPPAPPTSGNFATAPAWSGGTGEPKPKSGECSSDYSCAFGFECVKAPYRTFGYCAQKVNQFGTPTYSPPSPTSSMPGGNGQCAFDTECPVGFRCAIEPGALRGACLKR